MKIGFVVASNCAKPLASTRISVLNMLPYLADAGHESRIVFEPPEYDETPDVAGLSERLRSNGIEVAYFQKVHGPSVEAEVKKLSKVGIRSVFGVCDLIEESMVAATDATIAVTDYLKMLHVRRLWGKIHVVHDGIENANAVKRDYGVDRGEATAATPMRAALVTSSTMNEIPIIGKKPTFLDVTIIGRFPPASGALDDARRCYWTMRESRGVRERYAVVRSVFRKQFRKVNWDLATLYDLLIESDLAIIPVDMASDPVPGSSVSYWQVKSENRLTLQMSVGLPVIASPVPSYEGVIRNGQNGYIARTIAEWCECLEELRDPNRRRLMGESARCSVSDRFSQREQARKLIEVLEGVLSGGTCRITDGAS